MLQFQWLSDLKRRLFRTLSSRRRDLVGARNVRKSQASMERLEDRTLLASATLFLAGELQVQTDADEDVIVRANPANTTRLQVLIDNVDVVGLPNLLTTQLTSLVITTGDSENTVNLNLVTRASFPNLVNIEINTGNGHDTITGSPDPLLIDRIDAGDGDDTIDGQGGDDFIIAGDGNDSVLGGAGADSIDANDGVDTVLGEAGNDTIDAGDGDDTVSGGNGDDSIIGGDGTDTILSDQGNDFIVGNAGNDLLSGGVGLDTIFGGAGLDTLNGDAGDDWLKGNSGNDILSGGSENDSLEGDAGDDSLTGDAGNDTLLGGLQHDTVSGGDGNDTIYGGGGRDVLNGDGGDDAIKGQGGRDSLLGGGGADSLDGGTGDDLVESNDDEGAVLPQFLISDETSGPETNLATFNFTSFTDVSYGTATSGFGTSVDIGDMDGDGDLDFVSLISDFVCVSFNQGNGVFTTAIPYAADSGLPEELILADIDNDGDLDVTTSIRLSGNGNPLGHVLLNNGAGVLGAAINVGSVPFGGLSHAVGDVDGDSDLDLVYVVALGARLEVFLNDGNGSFSAGSTLTIAANVSSLEDVELGDIDNDGDLDALIASSGNNTVYVLTNSGSGTFGIQATLNVATGAGGLQHIERGDWDSDGDLDFATANQSANSITILLNNGSGTLTISQTLATSGFVLDDALTSGDLDNDGDLDLIARVNVAQAPFVAFVNQGGTFSGPVPFNPSSTMGSILTFNRDLELGDLNGDGNLDMVASGINGRAHVFIANVITPPTLTFNVTLSSPSTSNVTVDYSTANGNAIAGTDFTAASSRLTFLPGQVSQQIQVRVRGDGVSEPNENFFVNLTTPVGATISDRQGQGVISDDDRGTPLPTLAIGNAQIVEGNGGGSINLTVTLSAAAATPITVNFETGDATARAGLDYVATIGTLTFNPGQTMQVVTVPLVGDLTAEGVETFLVNLLNPSGATLVDSRGLATILEDDTVVATADDTLIGSDGNDTLNGSLGNDLLLGGAGIDVIQGFGGNDTIFGGAGSDSLNGGTGNDALIGNSGNDTLVGGADDDTLTWRGAADGSDSLSASSGYDTVVVQGTGGDDVFSVRGAGSDLAVTQGAATLTIDSSIRDVSINGSSGNDVITIGDISTIGLSSLTVNGDNGIDFINATNSGASNVMLFLNGGDGNDGLRGGAGRDFINGNDGIDVLMGRAGNDILDGGLGDDVIDAGDGNDTFDGGDGNDNILGGAGDDTGTGGNDNDSIDGQDGNDVLRGGMGDDTLNGAAGNDSVEGELGSDNLIGGGGNDTLDGGRNDDTIVGNSGNDLIRGNHGADSINGGAGDDTINAGDGDDIVVGGDGFDLIDAGNGNDFVSGGAHSDTIVGGDGNDTLSGGGSSDVLSGEQGDDVLRGDGGGNDLGSGGEGADDVTSALASIELVDEDFVLDSGLRAALSQ